MSHEDNKIKKKKKQYTPLQMVLFIAVGTVLIPILLVVLFALLVFIVALSPFITIYLCVSKICDMKQENKRKSLINEREIKTNKDVLRLELEIEKLKV